MNVSYDLNFEKFLSLWSAAENKRDKKAQYKLASVYLKSKRPGASAHAFQLFKKSAKQGFTDAAYMLARCYHEGEGINRNYRCAIKWYLAADSLVTDDVWDNPTDADREEQELIQKYFDDEEFADKIDKVLDLREEQMSIDNIVNTAISGNENAQMCLAHYYYYGQCGFEKNIPKAIFWYKIAAAQGNDGAMQRLAEYYNKVGQYKESAEWYRNYIEERIKWRNERLNW